MAALTFPAAPAIGDVYPADPGTSGVTQYKWDGAKWNVVPSVVSLGVANQGAFNGYQWPAASGTAGQQLTVDGANGLSWEAPAAPTFQILELLETIDGTSLSYTLVEAGTTTPFSPSPSDNILVFVGGVPQIPPAAYSVSTNTITFTAAPPVGASFYAVSSVAP
jgi:hypothetical protein